MHAGNERAPPFGEPGGSQQLLDDHHGCRYVYKSLPGERISRFVRVQRFPTAQRCCGRCVYAYCVPEAAK